MIVNEKYGASTTVPPSYTPPRALKSLPGFCNSLFSTLFRFNHNLASFSDPPFCLLFIELFHNFQTIR